MIMLQHSQQIGGSVKLKVLHGETQIGWYDSTGVHKFAVTVYYTHSLRFVVRAWPRLPSLDHPDEVPLAFHQTVLWNLTVISYRTSRVCPRLEGVQHVHQSTDVAHYGVISQHWTGFTHTSYSPIKSDQLTSAVWAAPSRAESAEQRFRPAS